jgi:hypothetical protein
MEAAADSISEPDFHLHNILLNGVAVDGEVPFYDDLVDSGKPRYKRFNFEFDEFRYDTHQDYLEETPYLFRDGRLWFQGQPMGQLPFRRIVGAEDIWGSERPWYFKSNPYQGDRYELRLNPVNFCSNIRYATGDGEEFKGCAFCHRVYYSPRTSERRRVTRPDEIFAQIEARHGPDCLRQVKKVLMITGDARDGDQLLDIAADICSNHLSRLGFAGTFSLCSNQIREPHQLERLARMDDQLFEYPIETFTNRDKILGPKGIPLGQLMELLHAARGLFRHTRVNYLIGLEPLHELEKGFGELAERGLIDDVIANIMTPFTPEMKKLRVAGADRPEFVFAARAVFRRLGIDPKRSGVTKDLFFGHQRASDGKDLLIRN